MKINCEAFDVKIEGSWFFLYDKKPRTVRETEYRADGTTITKELSFKDLFKLSSDPDIFHAWYDRSSDRWHCDQDCGAQRYTRDATTAQLRAGLKRVGLKSQEIKDIFKAVKEYGHGLPTDR